MKQVIFKFGHWYPRTFGIAAITMGNQVWFRDPCDLVHEHTFTHEMIHIRQIRKLGWKTFYTQYMKELAQGLLKYRNYHQAYMNISFEREAYNLQFDDLSVAELAEMNRAKIGGQHA